MPITNLKIVMSGATGFVGSHISRRLSELNCEIVHLGRHDFKMGPEDLATRMKGTDIIINLAGAPIIERWTTAYKKEMYDSRIGCTKKLVDACKLLERKPSLFISTSAVGYYSSNGSHTEEQHSRSDDYMGRLAYDWEQAALKAEELGIRTVIFRFGIVLGKDGGALKQMLTPFKAGLGGTIGDGSQAFSWVHVNDLMRAFEAVIEDPSYEGAYNLTAPNPTTNKGLTEALGKALHKQALVKIPHFALRLQYGEGAQTLINGWHVIPKRLLDSGFSFTFTNIEEAVSDCVTKKSILRT